MRYASHLPGKETPIGTRQPVIVLLDQYKERRMRIWDSIKRKFEEIKESIENPEVGSGQPVLSDDEEVRHEPVYDHVTGTESMQPVVRKKSELNLAIIVLLILFGCATDVKAQLSCPAGTQAVSGHNMRGSDDNIYQLECWDPVNKTLTFPNLTAGITFSGPVTTGALTPSAVTDGYAFIESDNCAFTATTTAFTSGPTLTRAAANNTVNSVTTNTTAGTVTVTCALNALPTRTTSAKGITVKSVDIYYGVQTTALSSIGAASVSSVTYPAAGGAAAGTVAAVGGSLTVTPGTLQLATTTSGQCYHENVSFGTTYAYNSNVVKLTVEQVFTTAGTTATTLQICGVAVNYNYQY